MIKPIVFVLTFLYVLFFITVTLIGLGDSYRGNLFSSCKDPLKKWELVLPAYRVGCWLGGPLGGEDD